MPTFTIPDNFTVSDAEFTESKREQEKVYSQEGGRQASSTYLDALGHARWDTDYVTLRMAGYTHAQACQEMRVRIREAWKPAPLPAIEPHVVIAAPPPVQPPPSTASPLEQLRAAIRQVDSQHPELKTTNTKVSCFEILHRALPLLGPDWAYVGKTPDMDGDGKYAPPGFQSFITQGTRPDGQVQTFTVSALSMDALWNTRTHQQFKAIANSTDGEPGGAGKPARLDPYMIEPHDYRWHNPPVPVAQVP